MIDFRYHLVSIVAVLLALGVGLVVGSGFIGGPLLEDIQGRVRDIRASNEELRDLAAERLALIDRQGRFAEEVAPYILGGRLEGVKVVLIETDGVSGDLSDDLATGLAAAGADVATTIELHDRFQLTDELSVDELALVLGAVGKDAQEVMVEAAGALGTRLAAAADTDNAGAPDRLTPLIEDLEDAGFLSVSIAGDDAELVPEGASFALLAGEEDDPPFAVDEFFVAMGSTIARRGGSAIVCEPTDGPWEVIAAVLSDSQARSRLATVSGIEQPSGAVAAALTLDRARDGQIGHHGLGSEASSLLPEPLSTPAG